MDDDIAKWLIGISWNRQLWSQGSTSPEKCREVAAELRRLGAIEASLTEPTDEMVWAVCNNADSPRDGCLHCPAEEEIEHYGKGTRGCRMLAEGQIKALATAVLSNGKGPDTHG